MYIKGIVTKGKSILHFISFGVVTSLCDKLLFFLVSCYFVIVFICTVQESLVQALLKLLTSFDRILFVVFLSRCRRAPYGPC